MDLRATPVGQSYAGVEIHANLVAGIMDGALKQRPSYVLGADVLQVFLAMLLLALLLPMLSPLWGASWPLSRFPAWWLSTSLYGRPGSCFPLAAGVSAILSLYALNMSWGYFVRIAQQAQICRALRPVRAAGTCRRDGTRPRTLQHGGKKEALTVLFSDVRGFTSISEGLDSKELTQLMNEYLSAMTRIIRKTGERSINTSATRSWPSGGLPSRMPSTPVMRS